MYKRISVGICAIFCFLQSYAQMTNAAFKRFSSNDGLSKNSITAILQDRDGFIWFGTTNGLNRFDGLEFKVYKHNPSDNTSLPSNEIQSLLQSKSGEIWIGTENSGVFSYSSAKDKFVEFDFFRTLKSKVGRINSSVEQSNGQLWFGADEHLFNYHNGKFSLIALKDIRKIRAISIKSESELWIISDRGILVFNTSTKNFAGVSGLDQISGREVRFINKTATGDWLFGTSTGAFLYGTQGIVEIEALKNKTITCLAVDLKGNYWIGTTSGLFQFDNIFKGYTQLKNDPTISNSLSADYITTLLINKTGVLFAGTDVSGVNICNTSRTNFSEFKLYSATGKNSPANNIKAIMQTASGAFVLGSAGAGLYSTKCLTKSCETTSQLLNGDLPVLSAYPSLNGDFLIGSYNLNLGIVRVDQKGQILQNYATYLNKKFNLKGILGACFLETSKTELWIGTNNDGLFKLLLNENQEPISAEQYNADAANRFSLSSNKILSLKMIGTNQLWIGTKNGLNILDVKNHTVKKLFYIEKNQTSVGSDKINTIFTTTDGKIFLGTAGGGLNLFVKEENGKFLFKRYTESEGLSNNVVLAILEDSLRNLWISTSYGLNKFNRKLQTFSSYYQDDGLSNSEFRHNAAYEDIVGNMYFGTINGVTIFNPIEINHDSFPPSVKIVDFTLFNKNVKTGELVNGRELLTLEAENQKTIILRYDENIFGFRFAALHYASPKFNKYKYRLKGFNEDWIFTDASERTATYTNLPSGNYEFEVMAANNYNRWGKPVIVKIKVLPAPWATWWAYMIYFSIAVIFLIIVYKIIRARQVFRNQLAFERNQQQIIKEVNKSKLNFFTNISHEFRTPLTLILSPLAKIIEQEKGTSSTSKMHQVIYRNAERLCRLIEQLMDFRELENGIISFHPELADLVICVEDCCKSFEIYATEQDVKLNFHATEKQLFVHFDKPKVENMIYNLLSNAFNYTPVGGKITVNLIQKEKGAYIEVVDTGEIIPIADQAKIFERFYTSPGDKSITKKGVGIGLALTKELVELHEGEISIESNDSMGTKFTITLPYEQTGNYRFNPKSEFLNLSKDNLRKTPEIKTYAPAEKPVVVVLEDHYDLRTFIVKSLESQYEVHSAVNGVKGLEMISELVPDLVVSDIVMPEMDGLTVCYRIKSDMLTAHIPVILLTARATVEDNIVGLKSGADDYLPKPFNVDLLLAKCHHLITTRRKLSELFREKLLLPDQTDDTIQLNEFIEKAIQLIEENLSDTELGIDFLTDKLNMSRAQLYRKFKALSNQTVKEFIRVIRLKNAAKLLAEGKLNMSEVCYETGFSSHSYFSKCFKEVYGMTPKEYSEKPVN